MSNDLETRLAGLPRFGLVPAVTPLQELTQLSRALERRIFVKRDDMTGLAFGGNKVRQAEFFIGEALAQGADTILAGGSFVQSNHARVMAAAARAAGLDSVILVRPGRGQPATEGRGNALLTRLLAGEIRYVEALRDAPADDRQAEIAFRRGVFEEEAARLRRQGSNPYVIHGSSTALGAMGYVAAAGELNRQFEQQQLSFSKIFVTSLGATHAGLALGSHLLGSSIELIGVAYQPVEPEPAAATIHDLFAAGARLLGVERPPAIAITTDVDEAGARYGATTRRSREALRTAAASDSLLLDPTYTAKGFAALLRAIEEGRVERGESVLFVHTGGLPGLFARSAQQLLRV